MSLGYVERHGEKKDGTSYDIHVLSYVVENESDARKMYLDSTEYSLIRSCKECGRWGDRFVFSGVIDSRGGVRIETLEKMVEMNDE